MTPLDVLRIQAQQIQQQIAALSAAVAEHSETEFISGARNYCLCRLELAEMAAKHAAEWLGKKFTNETTHQSINDFLQVQARA